MINIRGYMHAPGTSTEFPVTARISDIILNSSAIENYLPQYDHGNKYRPWNSSDSQAAIQIIAFTKVSIRNSNNGFHHGVTCRLQPEELIPL